MKTGISRYSRIDKLNYDVTWTASTTILINVAVTAERIKRGALTCALAVLMVMPVHRHGNHDFRQML